jgi:putative MFS transporter
VLASHDPEPRPFTAASLVHLPPAALITVEQSPLTLLHLAIMALCACGFAVDLVELALGGALSAVFTAPPYSLNPARLAWLVSSTYVGAVIGAPILGWAADRIGPKKMLYILAVWIGIGSILSALARTPEELTIVRLLAGIGLGAYPPVMIAYLTDIAPPGRRGAMIFWTCGTGYLAPPLAIFAVRWLTPIVPWGIEGWRWPFAGAGLVAVLAGTLIVRLPEAPHWLALAGRLEGLHAIAGRFSRSRPVDPFIGRVRHAAPHPARHPLDLPERGMAARLSPTRRLLILSLISFTVPIATVSFPLLTGPILLARHFSLSDTLFYIGLATFGPILGTFASGAFIDRFGRRLVMLACAGGMLGFAGAFFIVETKESLAISLIGFAMFTALYLPTMTMYGAELFAPSMRARGLAIAWAGNRTAAALAPALLVTLVHQQATLTIAVILGGALAVNMLVLVLLAPRETDGEGHLIVSDRHGRLVPEASIA